MNFNYLQKTYDPVKQLPTFHIVTRNMPPARVFVISAAHGTQCFYGAPFVKK